MDDSQKHYTEWKTKHKIVFTLWFRLYEILENTKLFRKKKTQRYTRALVEEKNWLQIAIRKFYLYHNSDSCHMTVSICQIS